MRFRFPLSRKPVSSRLYLLPVLVALGLTLLPMLSFSAGPRYWPGFFYAPFYTTDVFTDPATPAGQAGLHPEDRVVGANRQRIDRLNQETEESAQAEQPVVLLYELGRELTLLPVSAQPLGWKRLLEKWLPLLAAALLTAWLGWRYRQSGGWLAALVLIAAGDYWLNPGMGKLSGFDPGLWLEAGLGGQATAKWSAFVYWPFWTLAQLSLAWPLLARLLKGRALKMGRALLVVAALAEWASYSYDGWKSGHYNNPDYIIWHARAVFWPGWGLLLGISLLTAWRSKRGWWAVAALTLFVAGFAYPTTFDSAWPGPGPQWYACLLAGLVYWNSRSSAAANSAG